MRSLPRRLVVLTLFLAYRQAVQGFQFGVGAATAVFSLALVLVFAAMYAVGSRQRAAP